MRKTKIICTLGPATDDEQILRELMLNGMDVARFNMSHQTHECHLERIKLVKRLRDELNLPIALLLDTKGPEIRTGVFKDKKVFLETNQTFTLVTTEDIEGDSTRCSISFSGLYDDVNIGSKILIDDGLIELKVTEKKDGDIICTVINGGYVSSNKGINVPNITLSLPFLSDRDRDDIKFGVENDFDFIAASFTRSAQDIEDLKNELAKNHCSNIRIIAKIENSDGVNNIDEIVRASDGIMVARGDLGVEIPLEEIPVLQKQLIKKAFDAGKQVITATQMLDSMVKNPRPTRAETTDVANAIYDGTSGIMLSGETAAGQFPVESVRTMALIAERTEMDIDYVSRFEKYYRFERPDVTSAISHATCTTAHDLGATAIMTVSKSGKTAAMISKYRPQCMIVGGTTDKKVWRQMNIFWGVTPVMVDEKQNTDDLFNHVIEVAENHGLVKNGDLAVITAGIPLGISGTTNMLKVHLVGDVLASGTTVVGSGIACGSLCVCSSEEEAFEKFRDGDILVLPKTTNKVLPIIKKASGVITEVGGSTSHAAIACLALGIPVIVGANNATMLLKDGVTVTMDAKKSIVFSGNSK